MELVTQFKNYISSNDLFSSKDKLLLAVSGGIDSVVLCELCKQAGYEFGIAHCNFQLRGEDSERDERFVGGLAAKYGVNFHVIKFDTKDIAKERRVSTQEAARGLRYEWFEKIRAEKGYQFILTAHHADDNIETVLMNFFRGTGIKGIRGIEPKHEHIVRPLLFARRKDLEGFLKESNLAFVQDYTNQHDDYTRNYFRNQLIPLIEKSFPGVNENMIANISRFREVEQLYQQAVAVHKKKLVEQEANEIHLPVLKLKKTPSLHSVLYEIIKEYGFTAHQLPDIMNLLDSDSGKYVQSPSHRIIKNRQWLIIAPNETNKGDIVIIDAVGNWQFAIGNLQLETTLIANTSAIAHYQLQTANSVALLDADKIKFPMLLRKWKQGDYFYPLGMMKKKKLSRFFIDRKLSKTDKENAWVIEMDKKIIWVVGYRIDERFKITDNTKTVLKLTANIFQTG
ncbi:tRNA lysidine(34) synthetase TilS [Terrimonas pollutisoli]|uniref:tRNA lysidine(34) synthetase TilS n=1 Tax=Terrimonas pollutisoli TaxID=3034147 RepID=UPI0023EDAED2|nr:tRNA lysidine(34) synthetase TilS [Terrimonas sp. H1YJ31]